MFYFDSHVHSIENYDFNNFLILNDVLMFCAVSSNLNEFNSLCMSPQLNKNLILKKAFGIHPWNTDYEQLSILNHLLYNKKLDAVGEIGLDFFTEILKKNKIHQLDIFIEQIALAKKFSLPVIIHLRSAMKDFFEIIRELKELKAVIFHAFPGSPEEAKSIKKKLPQSYFSFGASVLSHRKNSLRCIKELETDTILLETDFPFQKINTVYSVYKSVSEIKSISFESLCSTISDTVQKIFSL